MSIRPVGGPLDRAAHAVFGTLRPTERRRAETQNWRTPCQSSTTYFDGAEGDRTPDLCSAIAALSQLSYSPASVPARGVVVPLRTAKVPDGNGPAIVRGRRHR